LHRKCRHAASRLGSGLLPGSGTGKEKDRKQA